MNYTLKVVPKDIIIICDGASIGSVSEENGVHFIGLHGYMSVKLRSELNSFFYAYDNIFQLGVRLYNMDVPFNKLVRINIAVNRCDVIKYIRINNLKELVK